MTTSSNSSRKDASKAERAGRTIRTLEQLSDWLDARLVELEADNAAYVTRRSLKGSLRR